MEYANGHIFFGDKGSLFAQPFDARELLLSGEPVRVADGVGLSFGNLGNLWLMELSTGVASRFSTGRVVQAWAAGTPVWSPAGDRVLFATFPGVAAQSLAGGSPEGLSDDLGWLNDISPDAQHVLLLKQDPVTSSDLWVLPLGGDKTPRPYLANRQNEMSARFSPDGHSVAYMSDESGRYEVYLQSFPTPGRARRISRDGGLWPEWSKDGRELYFIASDARGETEVALGTLMAAAIKRDGPDSRGSSPQALFGVDTVNTGRRAFWPGADGGFLIGARVDDPTPRLLTVVLNWEAALKGH